jgi:hypothetical protein
MRRFRPILPALGLAAVAGVGGALADDKADCKAGIAMIRSEIDKKPAAGILTKLQTALRIAVREDGEGEFDECMDAVKDARKALGR